MKTWQTYDTWTLWPRTFFVGLDLERIGVGMYVVCLWFYGRFSPCHILCTLWLWLVKEKYPLKKLRECVWTVTNRLGRKHKKANPSNKFCSRLFRNNKYTHTVPALQHSALWWFVCFFFSTIAPGEICCKFTNVF